MAWIASLNLQYRLLFVYMYTVDEMGQDCMQLQPLCVSPKWSMSEYGAAVGCYCQGKTKELGGKPVPLQFFPSQIPHGPPWVWTWASVVRSSATSDWIFTNKVQLMSSTFADTENLTLQCNTHWRFWDINSQSSVCSAVVFQYIKKQWNGMVFRVTQPWFFFSENVFCFAYIHTGTP